MLPTPNAMACPLQRSDWAETMFMTQPCLFLTLLFGYVLQIEILWLIMLGSLRQDIPNAISYKWPIAPWWSASIEWLGVFLHDEQLSTPVKIIPWQSPHCMEACQFQCFRAWSTEKTVCIFFAFVGFTTFCEYFRSTQDPLVHHGCHFGWTVHSFCRIQTLLTNSIVTMAEDSDTDSLSTAWVLDKLYTQLMSMLSFRERKEFEVFRELLRMVPSLEARLMASLEDEVIHIVELVRPIYLCWSVVYPDSNPKFRKV